MKASLNYRSVIRVLAIIAVMIIAGSLSADAAYKIIEKSTKKVPAWLYNQPTGTFLVEIERPALGEAQSAAETEIARRIISAVATNISHSTKHDASEKWSDNAHNYLESFTTSTETNSARLPFLKGISISKAQATYWEKREDKDTKRRSVVLSVLYPLPAAELNEMTAAFEAADNEKSQELKQLGEDIDNVSSSDQINNALLRLKALEEYFFDSVRKSEAKAIAARYKECFKALALEGNIESEKNRIVCQVTLNGHPFRLTAAPELSSNCASHLESSYSADGYSFIITYSDEDCLDTEENWIEVRVRTETGELRKKFFFQ